MREAIEALGWQPDLLERGRRASALVGLAGIARDGLCDGFPDFQARVERALWVLEDHLHTTADVDVTARGLVEPGDEFEQAGLA